MAANLSMDGKLWRRCRYCPRAIWRYPKGQMWRAADNDSTCYKSPIKIHVPEY